jgi:hypothetical protein
MLDLRSRQRLLPGIGAPFGSGLDQPARLQTMRPGLHRAAGDAELLGDDGGLQAGVAQPDEFGLLGESHGIGRLLKSS